ncbi:unnamed protein product [Rhizopus stolonifer]
MIEIGSDYRKKEVEKKVEKEEELKASIKCLKQESAKITKKQFQDSKKLLALMGVPIVESPGEAEAQYAKLAKGGKLCILLGCDYKACFNVSPDKALSLIQKHKSIQKITSIKEIRQYIPPNWNHKEARALLSKPDMIPASKINVGEFTLQA